MGRGVGRPVAAVVLSAGARGHRPAVEIRHNRPSRNRLKRAGRRGTLRSHRRPPMPRYKLLAKNTISQADPRYAYKL